MIDKTFTLYIISDPASRSQGVESQRMMESRPRRYMPNQNFTYISGSKVINDKHKKCGAF